jgi:hypothetical protein
MTKYYTTPVADGWPILDPLKPPGWPILAGLVYARVGLGLLRASLVGLCFGQLFLVRSMLWDEGEEDTSTTQAPADTQFNEFVGRLKSTLAKVYQNKEL